MKMLKIYTLLMTATLTLSAAANNWQDQSKDAWIDGKAETTLLLNANLNSFNIGTDVRNGVVTLNGLVASKVDRALAEELVEGIDGVQRVENNIQVREATKDTTRLMLQSLTDSKVASVVKTRLLMDTQVAGSDIDVDVSEGVVTLDGSVYSEAEKDLAVVIARNTNDVERVVDKLEVTEADDFTAARPSFQQ